MHGNVLLRHAWESVWRTWYPGGCRLFHSLHMHNLNDSQFAITSSKLGLCNSQPQQQQQPAGRCSLISACCCWISSWKPREPGFVSSTQERTYFVNPLHAVVTISVKFGLKFGWKACLICSQSAVHAMHVYLLLSILGQKNCINSLWPSDAISCHRTWDNIGSDCFRWWLAAWRHQAITWAKFNEVLWHSLRAVSTYLLLTWVWQLVIQDLSPISQVPMS